MGHDAHPRTDPQPATRLAHGDSVPQESAILDHLADGHTNREIATEMFLAEKTVKNYVSNLLGKLGMTHRTQAAVYAARLAERRTRRPEV